jgi:hypothetical protein
LRSYDWEFFLSITSSRLYEYRSINLIDELSEIVDEYLIFNRISIAIDEIISEHEPVFFFCKIGIFEDVFEISE